MGLFSPSVGLPVPWAVEWEGDWLGTLIRSSPKPCQLRAPIFSHRGSQDPTSGPRAASPRGQGKWSRRRQREELRGPCPFPVGFAPGEA